MAYETLICENGNHSWERERTRGRKPRLCPDHLTQPAKPTRGAAPTEKRLVCDYNGHEWTRAIQRGRLPKYCPEHLSEAKVQRTEMFDRETFKLKRQQNKRSDADRKVDRLELLLKSRGLHISQNQ